MAEREGGMAGAQACSAAVMRKKTEVAADEMSMAQAAAAAAAEAAAKREEEEERAAASMAVAMAKKIPAAVREGAVVYRGDEECTARTASLLREMGLPEKLLPVSGIVETGWVASTGFSWILLAAPQKQRSPPSGPHSRLCSYDTLITSTVTPGKMSQIRGVRAKELAFWIPVLQVTVSDPSVPDATKSLVFKSSLPALSRSLPFHLFQ